MLTVEGERRVEILLATDGRHLFFVGNSGQMMVAEVDTEPTFNHVAPTGTFSLTGYPFSRAARQFDLPPDGERFLVRRSGDTQAAGDNAFNGLIFIENWFEEPKERVPIP